eukprot:1750518-Pyramimonas_sp.AAC.1
MGVRDLEHLGALSASQLQVERALGVELHQAVVAQRAPPAHGGDRRGDLSLLLDRLRPVEDDVAPAPRASQDNRGPHRPDRGLAR